MESFWTLLKKCGKLKKAINDERKDAGSVNIRMKKWMVLFLAGMLGASVFGGCSVIEEENEDVLVDDRAGEYYTLRESVEVSPSDWNPHAWVTQEDSIFQGLCELGLVDIGIAQDGVSCTWIYEMASDIVDVTADFDKKEMYGILPAETGRVYRIDLNEDACWEDGTGINADTYIYSMQQLLDPGMNNRQAQKYLTGECAIANALDYYNNYGTEKEISWDNVGLVKSGDYQLLYITASPVSESSFLTQMTSNWLVRQDLYEAGKQTVGNRVVTDYGTAPDHYMSFGPYRMVSFEKNSRIVLEKNEAWYGWSDGKHEGQYQADRIVYDIIGDHAQALQQFTEGRLDQIKLNPDDIDVYGLSDFLMKEEKPSVLTFVIAADADELEALEEKSGDGTNKRVLSYRDFRKALSLSIDRFGLCGQATAAYDPAFVLVNDSYYCGIGQGIRYRDSEEAKKAILDLYGIEYTDDTIETMYRAVTGYDEELARELFREAYSQAVADGNYEEGQEIRINVKVSSAAALTPDEKKQEELLNRYVSAAAQDTGFEGKIRITFLCGTETEDEDAADGNIEMFCITAEDAACDPYQLMLWFADPDSESFPESITELCGWDPAVEMLEITADFDGDGKEETKTDTFQNWAKSVSSGAYSGGGEACLMILAELEEGILDTYCFIPYASATEVQLHSQKIDYASYDYNVTYGFGGIRYLKFNYTDEEWTEYRNSGNLSYE